MTMSKKRDKVQRKPKREAKFKNAPWFRQKVANFYRPEQKAGAVFVEQQAKCKGFLEAKFTLGNASPHNIVAQRILKYISAEFDCNFTLFSTTKNLSALFSCQIPYSPKIQNTFQKSTIYVNLNIASKDARFARFKCANLKDTTASEANKCSNFIGSKQNLRTSFKMTQKTNAASTNKITRQEALSKILSPQ